jgi:hypothetical protein
MDGEVTGSADRVRQVDVPSSVRALSTLPRIDYADAFLVELGPLQHMAEECARETLEGAPLAIRAQLLSGWKSIGLKIGTGSSERSVLGWSVRQCTPELILLGADSRIGMPGELLFLREGDTLLFATFVCQRNPLARAVWAMTEPAHVRMVRQLLDRAGRRLRPVTN